VAADSPRPAVATTAVDSVAGMLREAAKSGAARARAAAVRLPFRDAAFDLVVCRKLFQSFRSPAGVMARWPGWRGRGARVVIETWWRRRT